MRRRVLLILAGLVVVALIALATIPFWLGAAIKTFGPNRGVTFERYERDGYGGFILHNVEYRRPGLRVAVTRAEAPTPLLWLWRHQRGPGSPLKAGDWVVEVTKRTDAPPPPPSPSADRGWMALQRLLNRIAVQLERYLPQAELGAGVVRFPGGEITTTSARWRERTLHASAVTFRQWSADAVLRFAPNGEFSVEAKAPDGTTAALATRASAVSGAFTWHGQRAELVANFPATGWVPNDASVRAEGWSLPADALKLGATYARVDGSAQVDWKNEHFEARIAANSTPLEGKAAPPLKIDVRGQGDTQAFTIEALQADIPGVKALLNEPVTIERRGTLRGAGARLRVEADLAQQPWFRATGKVAGDAQVTSGENAQPVVAFTLQATEVAVRELNLASIATTGRLTWPQLLIERATIVAAGGEQLEAKGGFDFKTRTVLDATASGRIKRASIAALLPKQPEFDVVDVSLSAKGALPDVEHSGEVKAREVLLPGLNPLAVEAAWQGRGVGAERFKVHATSRQGALTVAGSVTREAARIETLQLDQEGSLRLKLNEPAVVHWKPSLQVEPAQFSGPQGTLRASATLGQKGKIDLAAANLSSRWFSDFLANPGPPMQLTLFALMGAWDRGPMTFSLTAGAAVEIEAGRTAAVNLAARGDREGVRIEALRATEADATVVNATGKLPATVHPGAAQLLQLDERAPVVFDATAAPNAAFWQKLAAVSGVELKDPEMVAGVRGTWLQPEGTLALKAGRLAVDPKKIARPIPTIEAIDVRVKGDRGGLSLESFAFTVEGQAVSAKGRLPVPDGRWGDLKKNFLGVAEQGADLQLDIPGAEVAVFTRFLPGVLAPQGKLQASVGFRGGQLKGSVQLRDAASKPLGPLGVLQEISADLELSGRTLLLREVKARSGGQPITLSGNVVLPEKGEPKFDLALKGDNLPFVRQTGLLLRGDLDLKLQTPESGPPRLNGMVRLRDSLFLSDVRSFLPKGGASAARRPPYFSVDTPPVNAWVLAVEVVGEKFMRLRTPVFAGVASAHFRLSGTLAEPRAIGDVEIEEGVVRMPFARFDVQQGFVQLTEADPHEPTIYLRGTGRRYDYDLTMEIDGRASAPNVVFTSSPALESEQLLLMVMTGSAPKNDINKTSTQRVTGLGMFLGTSLFSSLSGGAGDADRLTITSGEKISREGEETYDVEYRLTDRWTITGEKNEFDEVNVGLKWRVMRGKQKEPKDQKDKKTADAKK